MGAHAHGGVHIHGGAHEDVHVRVDGHDCECAHEVEGRDLNYDVNN